MGRPRTGQLVASPRSDGSVAFGFRTHVNKRRKFWSLGSSADGMTEELAWEQADRILDEIDRGKWGSPSRLNHLIRDKLKEFDGAADPQVVASEVIKELDETDVQNELLAFVAGRVHQLAIGDRRQSRVSNRLDFTTAYVVGKNRKQLGDLTAPDCREIARARRERANDFLREAKCMDELALALGESGKHTVLELGPTVTSAILRGGRWTTLKRQGVAA